MRCWSRATTKGRRSPQALGALIRLIDVYRTELQDKAMALGHGIFEETPADFEKRFGQYWRDWWRKR